MIDAVFALVNTLVLVGVLYYLFQKSVRDKIERAMAWEQLHLNHLATRGEHAAHQEKRLIKSVQHQQALYADLSAKMAKWHNGLAQQELHHHKERERLEERCEARRAQQERIGAFRRARAQIIPVVVESARSRLGNWAADAVHTHSYLAAGLARLQEQVVAVRTTQSVRSGGRHGS